jgi:hypothetical protein
MPWRCSQSHPRGDAEIARKGERNNMELEECPSLNQCATCAHRRDQGGVFHEKKFCEGTRCQAPVQNRASAAGCCIVYYVGSVGLFCKQRRNPCFRLRLPCDGVDHQRFTHRMGQVAVRRECVPVESYVYCSQQRAVQGDHKFSPSLHAGDGLRSYAVFNQW